MPAALYNSHMRKARFYLGLVPNATHFNDLQAGAFDALTRVQSRYVTETARLRGPLAYSLAVGAYDVTVQQNAAIDSTGLSIDWGVNIVFDGSQADTGAYQGTTAPAGDKKYIILAVGHVLEDSDAQLSPEDGLTYYYRIDSNVELHVYATAADYAAADDWTVNAALAALYATVISDGYVPILILQRRNGTVEFAASDVFKPENYIAIQSGDPAAEREWVRRVLGKTQLACVLTTTGTVAAVAVAVPALPGRIDITGGEKVLIGIDELGPSAEYRTARMVEVEIPATQVSLGALATEYCVRFKLDPSTGVGVVYVGTGDYPLNEYPGPYAVGTSGGANQGFRRTVYDLPLYKVVTNVGAGIAPDITALPQYPGIENAETLGGSELWATGRSHSATFNLLTVESDLTVAGTGYVSGDCEFNSNAEVVGTLTADADFRSKFAADDLCVLERSAGNWSIIKSASRHGVSLDAVTPSGGGATTELELDFVTSFAALNQCVVLANYCAAHVGGSEAAFVKRVVWSSDQHVSITFSWLDTTEQISDGDQIMVAIFDMLA